MDELERLKKENEELKNHVRRLEGELMFSRMLPFYYDPKVFSSIKQFIYLECIAIHVGESRFIDTYGIGINDRNSLALARDFNERDKRIKIERARKIISEAKKEITDVEDFKGVILFDPKYFLRQTVEALEN